MAQERIFNSVAKNKSLKRLWYAGPLEHCTGTLATEPKPTPCLPPPPPTLSLLLCSLWGCNIGDHGVAKLVDAVRSAAQIERLECVSGDPRRPASRRVSLPPASYYPARILPPPCRLWGNGISDKGFEQLSELVASHPGLRHLECVQSARLAHALPPFPT